MEGRLAMPSVIFVNVIEFVYSGTKKGLLNHINNIISKQLWQPSVSFPKEAYFVCISAIFVWYIWFHRHISFFHFYLFAFVLSCLFISLQVFFMTHWRSFAFPFTLFIDVERSDRWSFSFLTLAISDYASPLFFIVLESECGLDHPRFSDRHKSTGASHRRGRPVAHLKLTTDYSRSEFRS